MDLSGIRTAVLTGPVGSGKSSIIEGLTWALYGEARGRTLDHLVRDGADRAAVSVDLMVDGNQMMVTRTKPRGGTGTLSLGVSGDDPWQTIGATAHTSRETQAEVIRRIGVSYGALLAGPLMVQSDKGALMSVEPRDRRDLLLDLLVDRERWDGWAATAKARRNEAAITAAAHARLSEPGPGAERAQRAREAIPDLMLVTEELAATEAARRAAHEETVRALATAQADATRALALEEAYSRAKAAFSRAKEAFLTAGHTLMGRAGTVQELLDREPAETTPTMLEDARASRETADEAAKEHEFEVRRAIDAIKNATAAAEVTCPNCGEVFRPGQDPEHIEEMRLVARRLADEQAVLDAASKRARDALRAIEASITARGAWEKSIAVAQAEESAAQKAEQVARVAVSEAADAGKAAKAEYEAVKDAVDSVRVAHDAEARARYGLSDTQRLLRDGLDELGEMRRVVRDWDESVARAAEAAVIAKAEGEKVTILSALEGAFGPTGIPSMLLDSAIPAIEDGANEVLSRMPGGFRLSLRTQRATGKGTLADAVDVVVDPGTGNERDYDLLSGGQRFRVDLALRLGLTRVLASSRIDTLIVDEGLDRWQDPEGRGAVLDTLMAVADDFRLVLVVSHHPEVVERFGTRIDVRMEDGVSRVEVL